MGGWKGRWHARTPGRTPLGYDPQESVTLLFRFPSDLSNNSIGMLTNHTFSNMSHLSTL